MKTNLQKEFNSKQFKPNLIFLVVGFFLLFVASLINKSDFPTIQPIFLNFGIVVASVASVNWIWWFCGGNPIEYQVDDLSKQVKRLSKTLDIIESVNKVGLYEVKDRAGNFGKQEDWLSLINDLVVSIDLMGRTLYNWFEAEAFEPLVIKKIVSDDVKFRWLFISENNKHLKGLDEDGKEINQILLKKIGPVCTSLKRIREKLPEEKKRKLTSSCVFTCSSFLFFYKS